jgi:hypothetical protein
VWTDNYEEYVEAKKKVNVASLISYNDIYSRE